MEIDRIITLAAEDTTATLIVEFPETDIYAFAEQVRVFALALGFSQGQVETILPYHDDGAEAIGTC